jgi:GLPGLI family protein
MKRIQFTITFFFISFILSAQASFLNTVKIEYEKTVYTRQLYKDLYPAQTYERYKNQIPETTISYFDFIGDTTRSIFKPGRETSYDPRGWRIFANENVIYTDYKAQKTIAQKPVYEETFLIEDSLANIEWKLTADTRIIAGFECKKAIGIIHDSIAVFAFYADELLIPGGPESIHGLPGMVLGMGVPRLHTTWFATKVEVNGVNLNSVKPATKGKKVNYQQMIRSVNDVLKQWGDYGKNIVIAFMI